MPKPISLLTAQPRPEPTPYANAVTVRRGGRLVVQTNCEPDPTLTPWVHFLTPIAMRLNVPLRLEGPVHRTALPATRAAQRVLAGWYPSLHEVDVEADWVDPPASAPGVGLFFSGGVDSFYSALEHADDVTHLIFVTGFDIGLHKRVLAERALSEVREVAAELGKELLEARTNVRRLANQHCSWGRQYHGAALAGIAHMFSSVIGTAIIPSSLSHPWGSDPELDPLWSSTVRIVHDASVGRFDKVARIARSDLALEHLRVCYSAVDSEYNCGRCEKCQRTMISLYALGALDRCRTFSSKLDAVAVGRLHLRAGSVTFARENIVKLREMPIRDVKLERALERALWLSPRRTAIRRTQRRAESSAEQLVAHGRGRLRQARRRLIGLLPAAGQLQLRRLVRRGTTRSAVLPESLAQATLAGPFPSAPEHRSSHDSRLVGT